MAKRMVHNEEGKLVAEEEAKPILAEIQKLKKGESK